MKSPSPLCFCLLGVCFLQVFSGTLSAQMITGTWKGKIHRQKVEVKIIQKGDSLTGTSYYYESPNNYRRYAIKGYFDESTNAAVWWDDRLLDERAGRFSISSPGKIPMLSRADFNCPGDGRMMLDGKTAERDDDMRTRGEVHLDKTNRSEFEDEWDFVIDNYTVGANDPEIIDSIGTLAGKPVLPEEKTAPNLPGGEAEEEKETVRPQKTAANPVSKPERVTNPPIPTQESLPVITTTIEEKFLTRTKTFIKEIPVSGDTVELRFYDNAEIDGDSISLFLNGKMLFQHIRLTGNAYIIKLAVNELEESNELTMVAENLGAIPPNTSYMVALVNGERQDAYLASNEGSSAMIRLVKKQAKHP